MPTPTPTTRADVSELIEGMTCIMDAGGLDGFAREVMAEVKRCLFEGVREGRYATDHEAVQAMPGIAAGIIERRLKPDLLREQRALVQRMQQPGGYASTAAHVAAVHREFDALEDRIFRRERLVCAAVLEAI